MLQLTPYLLVYIAANMFNIGSSTVLCVFNTSSTHPNPVPPVVSSSRPA